MKNGPSYISPNSKCTKVLNRKIYPKKWLKKGPRELLAVANNSSLQLPMVASLEPHEICKRVVLQKHIGRLGIVIIDERLPRKNLALGESGGSW